VRRAERGLLHLEKDIEKSKEIMTYDLFLQEQFKGLTPGSSTEKRQALDAFRWMIEEYKVSLFAQELKTPYPISKKRLDQKMQEIRRIV
jgi:ATP-dependent helicase HrpA